MTTNIELNGNCETYTAESDLSVRSCQHDIILFRWFIHTTYPLARCIHPSCLLGFSKT